MLRSRHNWVAGIVCGALVAALGAVLLLFAVGSGLQNASYDRLFEMRFLIGSSLKPQEAIIVYMDQESHDVLGQSPARGWDRNLHARLVERLTRAGAKTLAFDVHFTPEEQSGSTTNFAHAIRAHGTVVLGIDVERVAVGRAGVGGRRLIRPPDVLIDAGPELGMVEVIPSDDLVVRKHPRALPDDFYPGLALQAAILAQAPITNSLYAERWVNYYGPPGTVPHCSYFRALDPAGLSDEFFRGKHVFVGARLLTRFAGERKDEYRSPYTRWLPEEQFISGAEIQATMFLNLLRNDWLRRLSPWSEMWIVVGIGLAAGLGFMRLRPWVAAACALVFSLLATGIAYYVFTRHGWFPWLIIVAVQIPAALGLSVLYNSLQLYLEKRLLEQSLALHLSPARAKQLLKRRELLQPGADKQLLSIMFTDIADFTKIAEGMDSEELATLMNNYFEQSISCVHETDGFLVKLIGDALFAIWNAPLAQEDHQRRALRTALLLQERVVEFSARVPLRTRIGLHTGVANVGNFGSTKRFDYTAIGENINLASRLEGLNKHLGTAVLASRAAVDGAEDVALIRCVGRFRLKGFDKAIEVFELVGAFSMADATRAWREAFSEGLSGFQKRDWDAAEKCFCKVLKLRAEDGPSRFYLARIEELRLQPPAEGWTGEVELREK